MMLANPVNQTERLYKIEQMLSESGTVPIETLLGRLEISRAPSSATSITYARKRIVEFGEKNGSIHNRYG